MLIKQSTHTHKHRCGRILGRTAKKHLDAEGLLVMDKGWNQVSAASYVHMSKQLGYSMALSGLTKEGDEGEESVLSCCLPQSFGHRPRIPFETQHRTGRGVRRRGESGVESNKINVDHTG